MVKNHGLVHRQPSAYYAKPESEYYIIERFIGTIVERSEYWPLIDAVRRLLVVRNSGTA